MERVVVSEERKISRLETEYVKKQEKIKELAKIIDVGYHFFEIATKKSLSNSRRKRT